MDQPLLLLVDDSAEVAFIVGHMCRRVGWEVATRADAELAWAYVQQQRPTLVLLDVHLPGASGFEFCRWVRAAADLSDLPIALLSQWQRPDDIATGLKAGADFVLSKDLLCQPQEWRQRIQEIIAWSAGRTSPVYLRCQGTAADVHALIEQLSRAARGRIAGQLGEEVVRVLLGRALSSSGLSPHCLAADRLGLDVALAVEKVPTDVAQSFVAAFAEQLWRMLGSTDSAPLRELLTPVPSTTICSAS
jgi:CheY-like chemotaxis protein